MIDGGRHLQAYAKRADADSQKNDTQNDQNRFLTSFHRQFLSSLPGAF